MGRFARVRATSVALVMTLGLVILPPVAASAAPPVPAPGTAAVFGTVVPDGAAPWDHALATAELHKSISPNPLYSSPVAADGSYSITDVAPGQYYLLIRYATTTWAPSLWMAPGETRATKFTLVAGDVAERNVAMPLAATVTGTVTTPSGQPLIAPKISLRVPAFAMTRTVDPSTGAYSIAGVPPGDYAVTVDDPSSIYNAYTSGLRLTVTAGATQTLDIAMRQYTAISGTVLGETAGGGTAPIAGAYVDLHAPGSSAGSNVYHRRFVTDSNGRFVYTAATMGLYSNLGYELTVTVPDEANSGSWIPAAGNGGALIYPVEDVMTGGYDVTLARGGTLSGRVLNDAVAYSHRRLWVQRELAGGTWAPSISLMTGADGSFSFLGLEPGDYVLSYFPTEATDFGPFWPDAWSVQEAGRITVQAGQTLALGDVQLPHYDVPVERIAGSDRFATSVALSRAQFADGANVPVVYLVNGLNYPDALTAGPAAIKGGGGMLLVRPDLLPAAVAQELTRLDPERVVVVGSTASVGDSVLASVRAILPDADIDRLGGVDRYATAALVLRDAFGDRVPFYLSTGTNFPDALAAAPVAGRNNRGVLIVPGQSPGLTPELADLLANHSVGSFIVVGGEPSVSTEVALAVSALIYPSIPGTAIDYRIAGGDRYSTATLLNNTWLPAPPREGRTVYLATGTGFADALAAGPLVGKKGDLLYLVPQNCIPNHVMTSILAAQQVKRIVLVGGEASLSSEVEDLALCPE